jgi:F-type H+-transporting ATPase subunit alpha
VGISVSRVGGNAQIKSMKKIAGTLKLDQAQFRELEAFSKFGSDLDAATTRVLEKGRRNTVILTQGQFKPIRIELQIATILPGIEDWLGNIPIDKIKEFEKLYTEYLSLNHSAELEMLKKGILNDEIKQTLKNAVSEVETRL